MAAGDSQTSTTATRTSPGGNGDGGIPLSTWLIGGAAFVVVLTAGALFLDKDPDQSTDAAEPEAAAEEEEDDNDDPVEALVRKHPLDLTSSFLDAQERGKLWNPAAMLAGIEIIIEDGGPKGPILFEYGAAVGQKVPGAPLAVQRHTISYDGDKVEEATVDSPKQRVALPVPNCPLEVAFRTLGEGGTSIKGRVGVLYAQSLKHGRPVWMMTNEAGQATSINADNCALMRR